MKKITKITSAVLMLILVMSIATTAFAATGRFRNNWYRK